MYIDVHSKCTIFDIYVFITTSTDGLLVPEGIICPEVSVTITGSIPLLMDY